MSLPINTFLAFHFLIARGDSTNQHSNWSVCSITAMRLYRTANFAKHQINWQPYTLTQLDWQRGSSLPVNYIINKNVLVPTCSDFIWYGCMCEIRTRPHWQRYYHNKWTDIQCTNTHRIEDINIRKYIVNQYVTSLGSFLFISLQSSYSRFCLSPDSPDFCLCLRERKN